MARSFIVYQGEDETPEFDLTEPDSPVHVIWEEIEAGGRAFQGESTTNSIPVRDEQGGTGNELSLPSGIDFISLSRGSRWVWMDGPDGSEVVMASGRIGTKDYSRGRQKADRAREVVIQAADRNEELTEIIVDDWVRPEETDVERALALCADYLDGSPRATTVLATTYVASGNTVTMPAKTYDGTNPKDIFSELALQANKLFFVTVDDEVFYDTADSTVYQAGIRISDRLEDQNTEAEFVVVDPHPTILSPNGGFEDGDTDEWMAGIGLQTHPHPVQDYSDPDVAAALGTYYGGSGTAGVLDPYHQYHGWLGETFEAGVEYTVAFWVASSSAYSLIRFGDMTPGSYTGAGSGDYAEQTYPGGFHTITWTPTANRTSVLLHQQIASHGSINIDRVLLLESGSALTFPPIWDVGPASTEDGLELVSGLRLYYGQDGAYVYVNHADTANSYWHAERSFYTQDPAIDDSTKATALANAMLTRLRFEERTYNVSIGPLNGDQVGYLKPGQLIQIKARAIPDADDQFVSRRIAQLKWTTPRPGVFFARMQLDRPIKALPYGIGAKEGHDALEQHKEGDSHPASAIVVTDADGNFTGTDVEAVLDELFDAIGAGPTDYLRDRGGGEDLVHSHGSVGATETIDPEQGNWHALTLDANLTLTLTNPAAGVGASLLLELTQDGTGSHTLTLPASVTNKSELEAAYDTTADTTSFLLLWTRDTGTTWYGSFVGGGSAVGALDDLSDVTITSPAAADRLRYNGSAWVNSDLHWEPMVLYDGTVMLDSAGNPHMHEVSH